MRRFQKAPTLTQKAWTKAIHPGAEFQSRNDGFNKRQHIWICKNCRQQYSDKPGKRFECACGAKTVLHFDSRAEVRRFNHLTLLERLGYIKYLELQPAFPIQVYCLYGKPIQVATYKADFGYVKDGKRVVEDVKGTLDERYLDPVFKLKRKLVEAQYDFRVQLVTA